MSSSIKKNLGLQSIYQVLNTIMPLITTPYLARVLGAAQIGVFSYTTSVVAYFGLLAMLGTTNYGTRTIAENIGDKKSISKVFSSVFALQAVTSLISIVCYILYLVFVCNDNITIATIQILSLVACLFDINWLFFGVENFSITVTRSIVIKLLTVASILVFVKNPDDLWIYTIIMLGGTLLSQLVLWIYLPKYVVISRIQWKDVVRHIKPNLVLFIPLLAMSVYHTMDKTMLGVISSYEQSGFYYNADRVINIPICILNGVGAVMLPRMTALFNSGKREEADKLFVLSLEAIAAVSCAMAFGIAAIANEFIPFFFGDGYESCIILTIVLAPVLIIKGLSNTVRTQYLVPLKMEIIFTKSVIAGAVTNLILNLALIPKMGAMGAVLGTLFAEVISCAWQFVHIRRTLPLKKCAINCCIYILIGLIMFGVVRVVALIPIPNSVQLVCEIGVGGIVFSAGCILFWKITDSCMYFSVFSGITSKIPVFRRFF